MQHGLTVLILRFDICNVCLVVQYFSIITHYLGCWFGKISSNADSGFEFLIPVSGVSSSLGVGLKGTVVRRDVVDVRLIGDCIEGLESVETPVTMDSESLDGPGTWASWTVFFRWFSVTGVRVFTLSEWSSSTNKLWELLDDSWFTNLWRSRFPHPFRDVESSVLKTG